MTKLTSLIFTLLSIGCVSIPPLTPEVLAIRSLRECNNLDDDGKDIINEIMYLALKTDDPDYYFGKLELLLNTPHVDKTNKINIRKKSVERSYKRVKRVRDSKSTIELEEYLNIEEQYEQSYEGKWIRHRNTKHGNNGYFLTTEDPLNILVHVDININGSSKNIEKILFMEDAAEKHLSIPGFSVNIVFYPNRKDNGTFQITTNPYKWANSRNWIPEYYIMAHEAMHLLGLSDEYDRIEEHAGNKFLSIKDRLYWFLVQMKKGKSDSKVGIMYKHWLKPLDRHACKIANLGNECLKERMRYFHGI